jgi:hypothetical protein
MKWKRLYLNENVIIFIFSVSIMLGPAALALVSYDSTTVGATDTRTYLGLAKFQLQQSPKRRYRVIVPFVAAAVNKASFLWSRFQPKNYKDDFALVFSFFIVNLMLMGLFGLYIYRYLRSFSLSTISCLAGLLVMLTCRYTAMCAGTPLAESLYFVVIAMSLLGIRMNNAPMLITAIFIGPFAKEAFIFIAPLIFFFSNIPKTKQLLYFFLSAILVFGFRYLFDSYASLPPSAGLKADLGHISNIGNNILYLFSIKGIFALLSIMGFWLLLIIIACRIPSFRLKLKKILTPLHICFFISVIIQLILSGAVDRMFYLTMPVLCLIVALSFEEIIAQF